jgi:tRNA threonylcarbamoyladenosine biosynthesis protein TsaE
MKIALRSQSPDQTRGIAENLAHTLKISDVLALSGELGAGKTELVKGLAKGLGTSQPSAVSSPTYVLLREYPGRLWLYHFDFYRLNSLREIDELGYEEYFDGDGVSVVEWADRFPAIFPKRTLWIKLSVTGETSRLLEIEAAGEGLWEKRLNKLGG